MTDEELTRPPASLGTSNPTRVLQQRICNGELRLSQGPRPSRTASVVGRG